MLANPFHHSFLVEPGTWHAEGVWWDEAGAKSRCTGVAEISLADRTWIRESALAIGSADPAELASHYEVRPLGGDEAVTTFVRDSAPTGPAEGTLAVIADTMLFVARAPERGIDFVEALVLDGLGLYRARGELLAERRAIARWALRLARTG